MQKALVVNGRLVGPRSVELDEPVANMRAEVEVLMRPVSDVQVDRTETISNFLRHLPAGNRSKEEIDQQIRAERDSWGNR